MIIVIIFVLHHTIFYCGIEGTLLNKAGQIHLKSPGFSQVSFCLRGVIELA
jgi:hypothetical protein